jgi:di- and tripeptidase
MVKARVSVRIVPDQDLQTIAKSLCAHLKTTFKSFGSPNKLEARITLVILVHPLSLIALPIKVSIEHTADWWLGSLDDPWFRSLEAAVRDEWGVEPLRIREGGVGICFMCCCIALLTRLY